MFSGSENTAEDTVIKRNVFVQRFYDAIVTKCQNMCWKVLRYRHTKKESLKSFSRQRFFPFRWR